MNEVRLAKLSSDVLRQTEELQLEEVLKSRITLRTLLPGVVIHN